MRWTKPCWIRKGSTISSIASRGSESAAAIVSMPTGPPPKLSAISVEIAAVQLVEAAWVDFEAAERLVGDLRVDRLDAVDLGEIAHAAQQPRRRCAACRASARAISLRAVVGERDAEHARAAAHDVFQLLDRVEIEPDRDAEAVAQRRRQQAEPRRRADQRELARGRS